MSVESYFELATTLIGWRIGNGITMTLVATGLVFVPYAIAIYRNWAEPIKSQESKSAAPVSLRRMEHDIYLSTMIIIFCFLPAVPVDPSEIEYYDKYDQKAVTAGDPDVPYMRQTYNEDEIRIPLVWWLGYQVSSILTHAASQVVSHIGGPGGIRPILLRVSQVTLQSETVLREMREFRVDCYERALAKYQNSDNPPKPENLQDSVDWLGSHILVDTPGLYKRCPNIKECGIGYHASSVIPGWNNAESAHSFQRGKPYCDAWWSHPSLGLRAKLMAELHDAAPWLEGHLQMIREKFEDREEQLRQDSVMDHEDRFLRRLINFAPKVMINRADKGKAINWFSKDIFSIDGIQQIFGMLAILTASIFLHVAMEMAVIGLPMVQALMLMLLYISIPIIVPYSIVKPSIIVRTLVIMFALRFLSALWEIAAFLDERLLETMYPDASLFDHGGSGTTQDVVLSLITLFSYISLPIAWFILLGAASSSAATPIAHAWSGMNQNIQNATLSGIQTLRRVASAGR